MYITILQCHTADVPLGEEAVLSMLGEKNPLSVVKGLGVGVSEARKVSHHGKIPTYKHSDSLGQTIYLWIGSQLIITC